MITHRTEDGDPMRYVASGPSDYINPSALINRDAPQFRTLDKNKKEHWGWKVAAGLMAAGVILIIIRKVA